MMSSTLHIKNSKLSSICFLFSPLAQQRHNSKKVPLIMSKKDKEGEGW